MKNLKKMLAVVMAVSVVAASVPAFAAVSGEFTSVNSAVTADYSAIDQNTVKAKVTASKSVAGKEMTFAVLDNNVTDTMITNGTFDEGDILYIDQETLGSSDYTFVAKIDPTWANGATSSATALPAGSYPIRVGYYYDVKGTPTFAIATATMVVGSSGKTVTIKWGDVGLDGAADSADAGILLYAAVNKGDKAWSYGGYTFNFNSNVVTDAQSKAYTMTAGGTSIKWGDVGLDGAADSADAGVLLYAAVNKGDKAWALSSGTATFNTDLEITLTPQ